MKLTAKILLLLVSVVALVTVVAGTISIRSAYADLQQRQQRLTEQLAGKIEGRLSQAWRQAGPPGVDRALHDWVEETQQPLLLKFVMFDSDVDQQLMPRTPRSLWPVLRRGEIFSRESRDGSGSRLLHTYLPFENWQGDLGALELTQPLSELDEQTRKLVWGIVLAIGTSAFVGLGMAYVAGLRWVARPLAALVQHTERVGQGDFTVRTELKSQDELDQLAQALNSMTSHLSDQQATIARETQERVQALDQLRHAERLGTLGRMAAGIAHELGTPLNVVAGRAALIASGKLTADEIASSAQTIKAEADRITSIVQRMLDFARQRPPHTALCDVEILVRRTISLVQTVADKKQIQIELSSQLDAENSGFKLDEAQIQQVLTNLIVNAVQATPTGGQVRVSIDAPGAGVRVSVDDSGSGVPEELRERIFEPFFTTKDVGQGTGLGLSIAYGIVQEHHGRLEVGKSELGGARFEMWLP